MIKSEDVYTHAMFPQFIAHLLVDGWDNSGPFQPYEIRRVLEKPWKWANEFNAWLQAEDEAVELQACERLYENPHFPLDDWDV